ncbi:peptidoglycan DD-metalloendopeptidase family protein [Gorillibacterium sp. CAU 1737]|uniref:peptidoglycan DD-metalloendopeptidase family protein n=1 Tax=Gorillibacterium sp. CAU 1737 TaxID=3140362 RepID=UPI00326032FB
MTAFKSMDWFRRLLSRDERAKKNQDQGLTATAQQNEEPTAEAAKAPHKGREQASKKAAAPASSPKPNKQQAKTASAHTNKKSNKNAAASSKGKNGKAGSKSKASKPMLAPGVKPAAKDRGPGKVAEASATSAKLTGPKRIAAEAKPEVESPVVQEPAVALTPLAEEPIAVAEHVAPQAQAEGAANGKPKLMPLPLNAANRSRSRRNKIISASVVAGVLLLVGAITIGGNHYVKANTYEVYHVYMNDKEVGVVSDPDVVDRFKLSEYRKLAEQYPETQMVLNTEGITVVAEKAFKPVVDDPGTLAKLSPMLESHAVGVELVIDGKKVGVLKNEAEVQSILKSIKTDYVPDLDKAQSKVAMLSAPAETAAPGKNVVEKVEFVEKVETNTVDTEPGSFSDPAKLLQTLKTGDVRPRLYKVVSGDTLGAIALKFDITTKDIQEKNPDLKGDFIREGQELNLTVLQPAVTVRTVEQVVETEAIAFGTEIIRDPNLKDGIVQKISEGKEGKKKVTFELTKENGEVVKEDLIKEEVLVDPVKAVVKRGTKVIRGEGTGNFAWPVIGASLSSGFGYRWGKLHKGIDLTSGNKNILASDNGVVESAGYRYDYGNYVLINHKNGYKTMYGHLSKISVSQGQIVEKGEKIGYMGSTGDSTGVHLHFEVIVSGNVTNPLRFLNR